MPGSRKIRNKIKSIKNTQKITKAMEMVAAAKMRKAHERTRTTRPSRTPDRAQGTGTDPGAATSAA